MNKKKLKAPVKSKITEKPNSAKILHKSKYDVTFPKLKEMFLRKIPNNIKDDPKFDIDKLEFYFNSDYLEFKYEGTVNVIQYDIEDYQKICVQDDVDIAFIKKEMVDFTNKLNKEYKEFSNKKKKLEYLRDLRLLKRSYNIDDKEEGEEDDYEEEGGEENEDEYEEEKYEEEE